MSSRAAGSILLRHLGPRVFGPAAPSAAAARPLLLALAGCGQGVRQLSTSASEEKADVGEVYDSHGKHLSSTAVKAEMAILVSRVVAASEARADVAEVYASKEDYASMAASKATISASEARADVAEVYASKEEDGEWKGK